MFVLKMCIYVYIHFLYHITKFLPCQYINQLEFYFFCDIIKIYIIFEGINL
jgi:hypothetical protein